MKAGIGHSSDPLGWTETLLSVQIELDIHKHMIPFCYSDNFLPISRHIYTSGSSNSLHLHHLRASNVDRSTSGALVALSGNDLVVVLSKLAIC